MVRGAEEFAGPAQEFSTSDADAKAKHTLTSLEMHRPFLGEDLPCIHR